MEWLKTYFSNLSTVIAFSAGLILYSDREKGVISEQEFMYQLCLYFSLLIFFNLIFSFFIKEITIGGVTITKNLLPDFYIVAIVTYIVFLTAGIFMMRLRLKRWDLIIPVSELILNNL